MTKIRLSYTSIVNLLECHRRYYFAHQLGITPIDRPEYFIHGGATHEFLEPFIMGKSLDSCLEAVDTAFPDGGDTYCKVRSGCEAYARNYAYPDPLFDVLATEVAWSVDTSSYELGGVVDGVAVHRDSGDIYILEHKTAAKVDGSYLDNLWRDLQVRIYGHIASDVLVERFGRRPVGVIYNVILKPGVRRLGVTKTRLQPQGDDQYLERCRDWYEKQGSEAFVREILPLNPVDREETVRQVDEAYKLLQFLISRNYWMPSNRRCNDRNRKCLFLPICDSGGTPANPGPIAETRFEKRIRRQTKKETF